jgi:hypothetical protein
MNIRWERKHWVVFTVLLASQAFGLWELAHRGGMSAAGIRVPLFFLPAWVIGSVFLTTIIIVKVFSTVLPSGRKTVSSLLLFWAVCVAAGVVLWQLIR